MGGFKWRDILLDTSSSEKSSIQKIPPEILAHVLSFLNGKDIANASKVNKAFHSAGQIESVWQKRCLREYGVTSPNTHDLSYKILYTKILCKYGHLIGIWKTNIDNYGGLLQVKCEEGKLLGIEWLPPTNPNVRGQLRRNLLFSVELTQDGQVQALCCKGHSLHKCQLDLKTENRFISKCLSGDHHRHPDGTQKEFNEWLKEESSVYQLDADLKQLSLMKFLIIRQYGNAFQHERLHVPSHQPEAIIQPGLFKGTYSAHGLELVLLKYEESGTRVKVVKVTGDPNVPAGQVSFKVDLHYPIILTPDQQKDIHELQKREVVASPMPLKRLQPQPFYLPDNCLKEHDVPGTCKARFYAFGQIAGNGFTNPSFTGAHWIIFNDDLFGLLWFDLLTLSLFHRVQETIG